jgi:hypothetical protein
MDGTPMRTVQISVGEIIEAMYADLIETYGDHELATVASQALAEELLARFRETPRPVRKTTVPLPPGLAQLAAIITR